MKKSIFTLILISFALFANAQNELANNTTIGSYVNPDPENSFVTINLVDYWEYKALKAFAAKPLEGCPNYVLSENQDWAGQTNWFGQDSLNNESQINLSVFIEVENSPLGLFQTKCDSVFTIPTLDWKEAQAYGRKYAEVILQEKIKQWNKK